MAKSVTVKFDGLRELGERMKSLAEDVNKRIARAATAAGAVVIRNAAQQKVPVKTGNLKKNIIVKRLPASESAGLTSEHIVTVRQGKLTTKQKQSGLQDAFYARWIEFGYVQQYLAVETASGDWITLKDRPLASPIVHAPRPFMRPAFDQNKERAVEAIKDRIEKRLKKAGA